MRIMVTEEMKKEWKERYLAGETARNIAKDFPFHESTISKHIKAMGISRGKGNIKEYLDIKPIILKEYIEDKYATCTSLGKKYGINDRTISEWLKNNNIPIKQNSGFISHCDETYFEKIDNPNKAYLLGFITADGSVVGKTEEPTSCCIEIHEKDKKLLEFAKQQINPEATITECHYKNKNNVRIAFSCKKLCTDLAKFGVIKNKSKLIKEVPRDLIPKNLLPFYFRGLIDGDGCILEKGGINIYSGSEDFIKSIQKILCEEAQVQKLGIYVGTTYFVSWNSQEDRLKLYNYLYKDKLNDTFYYERKFLRLYNSLFGNTEVSNQIAQG